MTDNQPKCFDVIGPKAIAAKLRELRQETNDASDPCSALLSTNKEPGVGAEIFGKWSEASEDGYDYVAQASSNGVMITGERQITSRLTNARGEVKSQSTKMHSLQPLFITRMVNNDNGTVIDEPLSSAYEAENLSKLFSKSKTSQKPLRYLINAYGSLKYLPVFQKCCPWVTVYNFDDIGHLTGIFESQGVFPHRDLEAAAKSRELFHTYREFVELPDPEFIIEGFAEQYDKIIIGGLSGHGKTLLLLDIVRSLLTCKPLFDYFAVPEAEHSVMYLIPEEGRSKFVRRLKLFGLLEFMQDDRLLVRTLSMGQTIALTDPRILEAANGRHVFLDTAVRFSTGDESSASDNQNGLAHSIFALEQAGAESIWGAHHSPKSFRNDNFMELENVLRGSGDIGAMLSTAYGVRQLDADRTRTWLQIENIKPRDIEPPAPFQLEGKPWIERGLGFKMISKPDETGPLSEYLDGKQRGRPATDEATRLQTALDVIQEKLSMREAGKQVDTNHTTVMRWVSNYKKAAKNVNKDVVDYISQRLLKESSFDEGRMILPTKEHEQ